ncbi:hypothetical protein TNIN_493751 [Trichonephila inaurata madagascariensis]|uniref:Uncharacterized protein n=1 Tax=Trichonephila inaurata madagascariensis TaxID=2747483 RepID=A0A8X6I8L9_9ARAC|nr:hypothetical protein TNIN_493751 [Trichonephila inaurata madagascariensis]
MREDLNSGLNATLVVMWRPEKRAQLLSDSILDCGMGLTIARLRDKFQEEKELSRISKRTLSGRPQSSIRERKVIERFHQPPEKSVRPAASELKAPKSNVHRILACGQWEKFYS